MKKLVLLFMFVSSSVYCQIYITNKKIELSDFSGYVGKAANEFTISAGTQLNHIDDSEKYKWFYVDNSLCDKDGVLSHRTYGLKSAGGFVSNASGTRVELLLKRYLVNKDSGQVFYQSHAPSPDLSDDTIRVNTYEVEGLKISSSDLSNSEFVDQGEHYEFCALRFEGRINYKLKTEKVWIKFKSEFLN